MKSNKKLCLLIILILVFAAALFACEEPPEVVTLTFTVDGKVHREYIIGHGEGLLEVPEVPQKEGYIASWSVSDFSEIYKDTTATAVYTKNFFKVTFKAENLIIRTTNVTIGSNPSSLPEIPQKTGYNAAWSITDFTGFTMDTVVMAVYTPILLDITFKSDADDIIRQVAYGDDFTDFPQVPQITGQRGEWMTLTIVDEEEIWSTPDFNAVTAPMTVKARYLPQIITITFDNEGAVSQQSLEYDQLLTLPSGLTKEGKMFGGWYLDDDFDEKAVNTHVTNDFSLFAYWITINNAVAASEDLFEFTPVSGGYAIAAAPAAALPDDLVLPNSHNGEPVVKIAKNGFENTAIKTIILPVGIVEIGDQAFSGCSQLVSAEFADKNRLADVGNHAFYAASKLKSISLAKSVKSIGNFAFAGCSELSAVTIPQNSALENIGERAFFDTDIIALNISQNIITIGDFAFANLYNIVFNFEGLQNLDSLGRYAFLNCTRLVSFDAPNILSIGDGAFAGCAALSSLTVVGDTPINDYFDNESFVGTAGSYLVSQTIKQRDAQGEYVLDGNGKNVYIIVSRRLPTSLNTITIREGCEDIAANLLNNCVSVHNINIPASAQTIGRMAFAAEQGDGNNLMKQGVLTIAEGSKLKEIGEAAFFKRTTFTEINFPADLRRIENQAFRQATNLSSINFSNAAALEYIGENVFAGSDWMLRRSNGVVYLAGFALTYKGATLVDDINLTEWAAGTRAIAPFAFTNITNIKTVTIPSGIKTVFESAFFSCGGITSITVEEGVESIKDNAFRDCANLSAIVLPESAKDLGKNILSGCRKLASLTVFGDRAAGEYFGLQSYSGAYTAAQTPIQKLAFSINQDEQYYVEWTETKDLYGNYPESYKITLKGAYNAQGKALDGIVLASLSHGIADKDFYEIGEDGAYYFSLKLTQGMTSEGRIPYTSEFGYTFYIDEHAALEDAIEVNAHFSQIYHIPSTLKKIILKEGAFADREITPFAFMNLTSVQELILPAGLKIIGEGAFLNCVSLGSKVEGGSIVSLPVRLPASLLRIGKQAFKGAQSLLEISYGSSVLLETIGANAFENSGLTSFYVPSTVKEIAASAFAGSPIGILQFQSSEVVTDSSGAVQNPLYIGASAFSGCNQLMNIIVPDRTVSIEQGAFSNNPKLGSAVFGAQSRLSHLGEGAFANNGLLTTISLPAELDLDLLSGVFAGDGALNELTLYNTDAEPYSATLGMLFGTESFGGSYSAVQNGAVYYIPRSLTTIKFLGGIIPDYMFQNASAIKIAELSGITKIGEYAFENCEGIEKIDLPSAVETIGDNAFRGCSALTAFNISENSLLEQTGAGAFSSSALEFFSFPSSVTRIEPYTFFSCAALKNIVIDSINYIGEYAFYGCSALSMLELSEQLEYIGDSAFYDCVNAEIPFARFEKLLSVGNFAFYNCLGLTALNAENLQTAGIKAFSGAYNLKEVTISGNTTLGSVFGSAYYENSYEIIQNGTYYLPLSLTRARLSSAATAVAPSAFKDAVTLNDIIFHGATPPVLGSGAFDNTLPTLKLFVPVDNKNAYLGNFWAYASQIYTHPTDYAEFDFIEADGGYLVKAKTGAEYSGIVYIPTEYQNLPVIGIAAGAFNGSSDITEIIIPAGIKIIGQAAFQNCINLEKVLFEGGSILEIIGADAFYGCEKLEQIFIAKTVREIGDYAFAGTRTLAGGEYVYSSSLSKVEFEKDSILQSIGKYAFYLTKSLKSINIPSSVAQIGVAVFSGSGIEHIVFGENSLLTVFPDESFSGSALLSIDLPSGVTHIGKYAFRDCISLAYAALGISLESIAERAFYNAKALASPIFPETLKYIGNESFRFCSALESITLYENVEYLGDYAFAGASSLYEVIFSEQSINSIGENVFMDTPWLTQKQNAEDEGVIYMNNIAYSYKGEMPADTALTLREGTVGIAPLAFAGQSNLKGVVIPSTIKSIGDKAFMGCGLESIVFEEGSQLKSIGNKAFYGAAFASLSLPEGLQSIGAYAFSNNSALIFLNLPESLKTIGDGAFSTLTAINTELILPDGVTSVGAHAFRSSAFSLTIAPSSQLVFIGSKAFTDITQLTVAVPAGITKLNDAFSETIINGLIIPKWVTEISAEAFKNSQISSIGIASDNNLIKIGAQAFYGLSGTVFNLYGLSALKDIGERAFYGCDELQSLVAASVSSIGISAFEGCNKLAELSTNGKALAPLFGGTLPSTLTKINITSGTTAISEGAFENADSIVSVYLPATLKTVSRYAFKGASSLETITFEIQETLTTVGKDALSGTKWLADKPSGVVYLGKIAYSYKGNGASAVLPAGTTAVAEYAFENNLLLTSVSLPASVTAIGEMAFGGCSALSTFSIGGGSALKTLGMRAFYGCASLTGFAIPLGVQNIAEEVFAGCSALVDLNYNGIKNLGYLFGMTPYADSYAAMQNGTEYYLPFSLKNIRIIDNSAKVVDYCFQNATELVTAIMSISVKEIGAYAFDGCTGMTQLTIIRGSGLEKIGDAAFRNCSELTTLYLSASATEIGTDILNGASALAELTVGGHALARLFGTADYSDSYQIEYQATDYYLPLSLKSVIIADGSATIAPYAYAATRIESVSLPSSLEEIGEYAFYGSRLSNIIQPAQSMMKVIKEYAFAECVALTSAVISAAMEEIGARAFYNCFALETVDFLSDYCQIGYQAFQNSQWYSTKSGLIYAGTTLLGYSGQVPEGYNLIVAEGTTDIAANAFEAQAQLSSVSIPASVKTVGDAAFKNCINLTQVSFIGESLLEEIANQLFYNCLALADFAIPSNVKKIGNQAFYNCKAFLMVAFGANSLLTEIGDSAFSMSGIISAHLPSALKKIGNGAFSDCISMTAINFAYTDRLEYIGDNAFYKDKNAVFNKTTFNNLTHIGAEAFYGCEKLTAVQAPQLAFIGTDALKNCFSITAITLTSEVRIYDLFGFSDNDATGTKYQMIFFEDQQYGIPVSLVSGYYPQGSLGVNTKAFFGFRYIRNIYLSDTVTRVGTSAFEGCTALESVAGAGLRSIGRNAFKDSGLRSIALPASIRGIEAYAFENCAELLSVTLAQDSALANIGDGAFLNAVNAEFFFSEINKPLTVGVSAFKNCEKLTSFLAPNVISYGDGAFEGCSGLISLTVTTDAFVGRLFGTTSFEGGYAVPYWGIDYYIPQELTDIYVSHFMTTVADDAFAGLTGLEYVWLNGVSSIGSRAFSDNTALTEIDIPASVVIIYDHAFEGCENLASVNLELPDTLTYIGEGAFDDTSWYGAMVEGITGTVYIGKVAYAHIGAIGGTLSLREDTIGISPKAFINQTSLTEIRLPLTLSAIGAGAFQNCSAVETVYMAGNFNIGRLFGEQNYGLSYAAVQNGATYYIPQSLRRVYILSGSTQLGSEAFAGCYTLISVTLPATLYNIGAQPLKGCYGLTVVTTPSSIALGMMFGSDFYENSYAAVQNGITYYIPSSLRTVNALGGRISAHAYQGLSSLTAVNIPSSVTQIGAYALAGCSGLTEISLHNNITRIDEYAFKGCSGITAISLPSGATVGAGALSGCSLLASISIKGNAPLHNLFGTVSYDGSYQVRQANKYFYVPSSLTNIIIKDTTVIADSLLEGFSAVSTLSLPNNITKIGAYAFYGLQVLNEIALPATLSEVGESAFYDNRRTVFSFTANNIQKVGTGAFQNCYRLAVFDSSAIVSIGEAAFSGCSALASLGVRAGNIIGKYFGQQMFVDAYPAVQQTGAVSVAYYLPNALTAITVYGGGTLTEHMFANMSKLKTITLLGEVSIPATAFTGCTGVTTLVGADIIYIQQDALLPLPWLNTYLASRPNNTLVYIGRVAYRFKGVMDIGANISFNANTTQLYSGAFANQTRLVRVNISANMRHIDISAFQGCTAMNYIAVDANNAYFSSQNGILYNKAGDTLIYRPLAMA